MDGVEIKASPGTVITIGDPNTTIKFTSPTNLPSGGAHSVSSIGAMRWQHPKPKCRIPHAKLDVFAAADAVPASSIDRLRLDFWSKPTRPPAQAAETRTACIGQTNNSWASTALIGSISQLLLLPTEDRVHRRDRFANAGAGGQFPNNNDWTTFNIPGAGLANDDNSSIAVMYILYFPAPGTYILGGNSDEGLRAHVCQELA
jgi:hypothetical protein